MKRVIAVFAVFAFMFVASPTNAEQKQPRPAFEAAPQIVEKYATLEAAARIPLARVEQVSTETQRLEANGELVAVVDQIVTIRVRVTPQQSAILRAAGVRQSIGPADAEAVIHDGWFYQSYSAVWGLDLSHIDGRTGREVRLDLAARDDGRRWVVAASLRR